MRFAHLSYRGGQALVDPSLVGVVARVEEHPVPELRGKTMVRPRHGDGVLLYCDEDPEEAGRRIMAAADGATVADVDEAFKEFTAEIVTVIQQMASGRWATDAYSKSDAAYALRAALETGLRKLKATVLKAAYVAEGKEI